MDVSYNRIGKQGLEAFIRNMHISNKRVMYFEIASNGLSTFDNVSPLFNYPKKILMNEELLEEYE